MMFTVFKIASFWCIAFGGCVALPSSRYTVRESHPIPPDWTEIGRAPLQHVLKVDIALRQSNFDEFENQLYAVSEPDHEQYGRHLSATDIHALLRPSTQTSSLAREWLTSNGIAREEVTERRAGDWISMWLSVERLEHLLKTEYRIYARADGSVVIRTTQWSLPTGLHEHIDLISPTTSFFVPRKLVRATNLPSGTKRSQPIVPAACDEDLVTPECLRLYYGTHNYTPQVPTKNRIGLTDYLGNSNNRSDTRLFLEKFRPDAVPGADEFNFVSINGGSEAQRRNKTELEEGIDVEGNLDIQTIISQTYPTAVTAFTTGGSPPFKPDDRITVDSNEPYLDWLQYVLSLDASELPQVISTSYSDEEQTVPFSYAQRTCRMMAELGARGVSLFFSSGDHGVGKDGYCFTNDGQHRKAFVPVFPASCPYVTAVGGTQHFSPEAVASDADNGFFPGGGFSNYFSTPWYQVQDGAVSKYIEGLGGQFEGLYNKEGRGYPDLAAQSTHFPIVWYGMSGDVDGTSASTPLAASIFSLVNDALIAAGRPPLGFLNPWLYKFGQGVLHDVVNGSTMGCNSTGFPAAQGWDAASGFGSPMFPDLLKSVMRRGDHWWKS